MLPLKSYAAFAFLGICVFSVLATTLAQESTGESDAELQELLKEKRDFLAGNLSLVESRFENGDVQSQAVLNAKLRLLDAELALASSTADRIEILQDQLDVHQVRESQCLKGYNLGQVAHDDYVDAVVQRIDAAIALAREKNDN